MKIFVFEIKSKNSGRRYIRSVSSKHLQGAVKKLYQEVSFPFELKEICKD